MDKVKRERAPERSSSSSSCTDTTLDRSSSSSSSSSQPHFALGCRSSRVLRAEKEKVIHFTESLPGDFSFLFRLYIYFVRWLSSKQTALLLLPAVFPFFIWLPSALEMRMNLSCIFLVTGRVSRSSSSQTPVSKRFRLENVADEREER